MILPTAVVPPPEYVPMDRFGALAQTSASIPLLLVILIELWKVCCSMFFRTFESCICISRTALLIVCSLFISCTSLEILNLSLIHISEPTRRTPISYAVFCLKKKNQQCS
eukprot:TRINITY_DN1089_c0_g1_i11.p1 TRINITY_DN1089_c0_g1~~TRINITY_DN1089_c0_g1_i11.p1  ORF type:complete len:110 (+),score=18.07 TRINITY_DN1089_c0_g1_i11:518-847(+)